MSNNSQCVYFVGQRIRVVKDGNTYGCDYRTRIVKGDRGTVIELVDYRGKLYPVVWTDADGPRPAEIPKHDWITLSVIDEYIRPLSALEELAEIV